MHAGYVVVTVSWLTVIPSCADRYMTELVPGCYAYTVLTSLQASQQMHPMHSSDGLSVLQSSALLRSTQQGFMQGPDACDKALPISDGSDY